MSSQSDQCSIYQMSVVIPSEINRKKQRDYDQFLSKLRHLVENEFLLLKQWRGIATRYTKYTASFVAAVQIRCIAIWAYIFHNLLSTPSSKLSETVVFPYVIWLANGSPLIL